MKKAFYLILAGVAIGFLTAPDKGSETRRKLRDRFEDWKEEAADQWDNIASQGSDLAEKGKETVSVAKNEARQTVNEW